MFQKLLMSSKTFDAQHTVVLFAMSAIKNTYLTDQKCKVEIIFSNSWFRIYEPWTFNSLLKSLCQTRTPR